MIVLLLQLGECTDEHKKQTEVLWIGSVGGECSFVPANGMHLGLQRRASQDKLRIYLGPTMDQVLSRSRASETFVS